MFRFKGVLFRVACIAALAVGVIGIAYVVSNQWSLSQYKTKYAEVDTRTCVQRLTGTTSRQRVLKIYGEPDKKRRYLDYWAFLENTDYPYYLEVSYNDQRRAIRAVYQFTGKSIPCPVWLK